jgi:hypothetical protein
MRRLIEKKLKYVDEFLWLVFLLHLIFILHMF